KLLAGLGLAPALGLRAGADDLFRRPSPNRSAPMRFLPLRGSPRRRGPCRSLTAQQLSLEQLEDRSVPTAGPLPIPGGLPGFNPAAFFGPPNLPGPADAPPPFGNEPISITNFNGFVGVAHVEGAGHDGQNHTLLWDVDLRFISGQYRGTDGLVHHGTFAVI